MSVSMRTANMSIYPQVYRKDDRVYCSTELSQPVTFNCEFSPDGGHNPKHLQTLFEQCADNGQEVEIVYNTKKGRFGEVFVIYDLKPVNKPVNKPAV